MNLGQEIKEHRGLAISTVLFVYLAFRVLAVSNWTFPTALAVLSSAGPVSVAVGALVSLIPLLGFMLIVLGTIWAHVTWQGESLAPGMAWLALGLGLMIGAAAFTFPLLSTMIAVVIFVVGGAISDQLSPERRWKGMLAVGLLATSVLIAVSALFELTSWLFYGFLALVATAISVTRRHPALDQKRTGNTAWWNKRRATTLTVVVALATLVSSAFSASMWLPSEVISDDNGSFVGYVLIDDESWTTVLRHDDRQVRRLATEDVRERIICDSASLELQAEESLAELISDADGTVPSCDDILLTVNDR